MTWRDGKKNIKRKNREGVGDRDGFSDTHGNVLWKERQVLYMSICNGVMQKLREAFVKVLRCPPKILNSHTL